jgi:hypothetical protein
MKNVIIPAGKVIIEQYTIEQGTYLELTTFTNPGGIILLVTIPLSITLFVTKDKLGEENSLVLGFNKLVKDIEIYLRYFIVDIKLTDAIRYVILGQIIILLIILL